MKQGNSFLKSSVQGLLTAGLLSICAVGLGQAKPATMPDAQIEANVLKALASAPQLAEQAITTTTVYGVVTLSGTVQDEASRDTAEHLAANAAGVQKVVDQLTIGAIPPASGNPADGAAGTNPTLQSDGTMAPPQGQAPPDASGPPAQGAYPQGGQYPPAGQTARAARYHAPWVADGR